MLLYATRSTARILCTMHHVASGMKAKDTAQEPGLPLPVPLRKALTNFLRLFPSVLCVENVEEVPGPQELVRIDPHFRCLSPGFPRRLVHHQPGVGQGPPLALLPCRQQQCCHGRRLANAQSANGRSHVLNKEDAQDQHTLAHILLGCTLHCT